MHGDEPTATSALIDLFTVLQKNRDKAWVKRIESTMTIRAVPMLNPDGTDAYIRRNMQGLDISRDALDLKSPEAQLLKRPVTLFAAHPVQRITGIPDTVAPQQEQLLVLVVTATRKKLRMMT